MNRAASIIAIVLTGIACLNVGASKPETYQNAEFGILLPVPKSSVRCPTSHTEHDQGPVILLGASNTTGCSDVRGNRYIEVFAGYNEAYVTKRLPDLLRWDCKYFAKERCSAAPSNLQIAGLESLAASVSESDGWVFIIVVTQAGKPDPAFDPSVPSVNFNLILHTRSKNLQEDLRTFRLILQTIRLSPPDQ